MGEVRLTSAETDRGTVPVPGPASGRKETGGDPMRQDGGGGRETGRETGRGSTRSRRGAAFAVWYLRAVTFVNFLSAVWVSLGQDLRRHNTENFYTPYLLTAGFASGLFCLLLAVTMGRRKRAAWILNLVLGGMMLIDFARAAFVPCADWSPGDCYPEFREHAQNWVSLGLTAAFVAALLLGRREFYAKGDRSNPALATVVAAVGLLFTSLVAALLVGATNTSPTPPGPPS